MNYFYFVAILAFLMLFLNIMNVNVPELMINMTIRCVSGLIFIDVVNNILNFLNANFIVNINQISVAISGILGITGVSFLYLFQWILTTVL